MPTEEEVLRALYQGWYEEETAEVEEVDPIKNRLSLISFVSKSNGANRSKRRPREVALLIDHGAGGIAYQVRDGEIRSRKSKSATTPDKLAQEVLATLPNDERTEDKLLSLVRRNRSRSG